MAYMLLKDTGIYANNQVIRNGLNFAQGLAVKSRHLSRDCLRKNDISMKYIKGRNDGRIS